MLRSTALVALSGLLATVSAQQVGTNTAEVHPGLTWYKCTTSGGCVSQAGKIVLDANWRWAHTTTGYTNCYSGNAWDASLCPDPATCAQNCAVDGADYSGTYGITTSGNALTLNGVCDPDGCDFNSYRQGDTGFYGPGKTVDTTKKFTIVTQFITDNGTATGKLTEIRRLYVQNGVVIQNSVNKIAGIPAVNSITDAYCDAQKTTFGDQKQFQAKGGLVGMGQSLARGGVLVLSVWDDYAVNMLWLDSQYPTDCTKDGCYRGTCATTSGVPTDVEVSAASATVTYSNIRVGDIGSTYSGTTTSTTSTKSSSTTTKSSTTTTNSAPGGTQTHYGQCGGQTYNGPTVCASPYTCQYSGPYYSQCL
ncbi:hypothetical protein M407DRAFT_75572 [Tulasnella calospora MUT 4182]|uniref:Glucanase n=1 Tax=Tulasnella calospora MUT 4182 TaxID=1051891 RepID=A0A0C3QGN1_9AGAM|nr:hypothetical protein M407DRAFT_75572 [Tulasnella calospora MUT 4182]